MKFTKQNPDFVFDISSQYALDPNATPAGLDADLRDKPDIYRLPSYFDHNSPIEDALVDDLVKPRLIDKLLRNKKRTERAVWIRTRIDTLSLGQGETALSDRGLASTIIAKGNSDSDICEHMLGCLLGGPMRHYNLFPKTRPATDGVNSELYHLWRGMEHSIYVFVGANPGSHVTEEVRLYYDDLSEHPNRPTGYKVRTSFFTKRKTDDFDDRVIVVLSNTLAAVWENVEKGLTTSSYHWARCRTIFGKDGDGALKEMAKMSIRDLFDLFNATMEELNVTCQIGFVTSSAGMSKMPLKKYLEIVDQVCNLIPIADSSDSLPEAGTSGGGGRGLSFWDFVPVVSSVRSIQDAATAKDAVMGFGWLVLDIYSLGSAGVAAGASKVVGKQLVKVVGKQLAKQAAKDVGKNVAFAAAGSGLAAVLNTAAGYRGYNRDNGVDTNLHNCNDSSVPNSKVVGKQLAKVVMAKLAKQAANDVGKNVAFAAAVSGLAAVSNTVAGDRGYNRDNGVDTNLHNCNDSSVPNSTPIWFGFSPARYCPDSATFSYSGSANSARRAARFENAPLFSLRSWLVAMCLVGCILFYAILFLKSNICKHIVTFVYKSTTYFIDQCHKYISLKP